MLTLLTLALALSAQTPILPERPRLYVDTANRPLVTNTVTVAPGDNLQTKLNTAAAMDNVEVILDSTGVWTGNFVLPARTGAGWVWIHPSNMATVPSRGTRASCAAYAGNVPKISTNTTGVALGNDNNNATQAARLAHHYWITGLHITRESTLTGGHSFVYLLTSFNASSDGGDVPGDVNFTPHHIVLEQNCISGLNDVNKHVNKAIRANANYFAAIDNDMREIHDAGTGGESQAIHIARAAGPFKIVNNYMEAATETFMMGGSPGYQDVTASNLEFRHNFVSKKVQWRTDSPTPPVKNLFELKEGIRVLVEENLMEYSWQGGQYGFGIVLTPRTEQSGPWKSVEDITIINNVVRHVGAAVNSLGVDDACPVFNMVVNVSGVHAARVSGNNYFNAASGMTAYINNAGPYGLDISTTLNGAINNSVTTITLTDSTIGPVDAVLSVSSGSGTERMLVTGVAGANRTVTRGYGGTTGLSHTSGSSVISTNVATLTSNLGTLINAVLISELPCKPMRRVLIQNNLFDDVSDTWGDVAGGLLKFSSVPGFYEYTFDRNTMINAAATKPPVFHDWGASCESVIIGLNWQFTRNAFSKSPTANCSPLPAALYTSDTIIGYLLISDNLLIGLDATAKMRWTLVDANAAYPATEAAVGFTAGYYNIVGTAFANGKAGAQLSCFDEAAIRAGTPPATRCSAPATRLQ